MAKKKNKQQGNKQQQQNQEENQEVQEETQEEVQEEAQEETQNENVEVEQEQEAQEEIQEEQNDTEGTQETSETQEQEQENNEENQGDDEEQQRIEEQRRREEQEQKEEEERKRQQEEEEEERRQQQLREEEENRRKKEEEEEEEEERKRQEEEKRKKEEEKEKRKKEEEERKKEEEERRRKEKEEEERRQQQLREEEEEKKRIEDAKKREEEEEKKRQMELKHKEEERARREEEEKEQKRLEEERKKEQIPENPLFSSPLDDVNPWEDYKKQDNPQREADQISRTSSVSSKNESRSRNVSYAIMPVELDEDSTKQRRELQQDDSSQIDDDYLESGVKIAVIDAEEGKPGTPDKILFTHTLYTVKVNLLRTVEVYKNAHPSEFLIHRRYNQFELLYSQLTRAHPNEILPLLPEKNFFGRFTEDVIKERVGKFNELMDTISRNPTFAHSPYLLSFLGLAEGLGIEVEEDDDSLLKKIGSVVGEVLDMFVEGVDQTVAAITSALNKNDGNRSNDRLMNQDSDNL